MAAIGALTRAGDGMCEMRRSGYACGNFARARLAILRVTVRTFGTCR